MSPSPFPKACRQRYNTDLARPDNNKKVTHSRHPLTFGRQPAAACPKNNRNNRRSIRMRHLTFAPGLIHHSH